MICRSLLDMEAILTQVGKSIDGCCKYMHTSVLEAECVCVFGGGVAWRVGAFTHVKAKRKRLIF